MAITPLVYPPWARFGLSIEQYVEIELAEERTAKFPLKDAIEEARLYLVWEGLAVPSEDILAAAIWDARRGRQFVRREVNRHMRTCQGCEECSPQKEASDGRLLG